MQDRNLPRCQNSKMRYSSDLGTGRSFFPIGNLIRDNDLMGCVGGQGRSYLDLIQANSLAASQNSYLSPNDIYSISESDQESEYGSKNYQEV